jgi:disulfide bond formation protein DsbB
MPPAPPRLLNLAGFAACAAMLGYALYAEHVLGLEPCPLCMFQRVGVALLGLAFLFAAANRPRSSAGARVNAVLIGLATLAPVGVAARHVWVQSQPPGTVPACGATLDYMLEVFPLFDVVKRVLTGGGECARIDWTLLGLSMPAWVLIASLAVGGVGVYANARAGASVARFVR